MHLTLSSRIGRIAPPESLGFLDHPRYHRSSNDCATRGAVAIYVLFKISGSPSEPSLSLSNGSPDGESHFLLSS